ncbi:hypothetical protein CSUI_006708, partial [Cystoisospora suis]
PEKKLREIYREYASSVVNACLRARKRQRTKILPSSLQSPCRRLDRIKPEGRKEAYERKGRTCVLQTAVSIVRVKRCHQCGGYMCVHLGQKLSLLLATRRHRRREKRETN